MLHCIQFNSCLKQVEGCSAGENASQEWINCQFLILSHHCSVIWVNTWLVTKCQTRWGFTVDYKVWLPSMKAVPSVEYEVSTFSWTASWKQPYMLSTGLHRHTGCLLDCLKKWHTDGVCVCVCAISRCTFCVCAVYSPVSYMKCVLRSEFGHVWLLTTLVYLLKLLYVNSCMVGGHMAWNLFILSIVCVYTFFCIFLYSALCPRSC